MYSSRSSGRTQTFALVTEIDSACSRVNPVRLSSSSFTSNSFPSLNRVRVTISGTASKSVRSTAWLLARCCSLSNKVAIKTAWARY